MEDAKNVHIEVSGDFLTIYRSFKQETDRQILPSNLRLMNKSTTQEEEEGIFDFFLLLTKFEILRAL